MQSSNKRVNNMVLFQKNNLKQIDFYGVCVRVDKFPQFDQYQAEAQTFIDPRTFDDYQQAHDAR
jgi:hypothetical protein